MRSPFLLTLLAAIGCDREEAVACMSVEDTAATCPSAEEVDPEALSAPWDCDNTVVSVLEQETPSPETGVFQVADAAGCCYDTIQVDRTPNSECMVGRPLTAAGRTLAPSPHLPADPVAAARIRIAALEHASVGAFAALTLDLLQHGAPPRLLADVQRASRDELRHAASWLKLSGQRRPLGPMPMSSHAPRSLAEVAAQAAREGCLGETASAILMRAAADAATDAKVKAVLSRVATDEERHALLSWRIVAWALRTGGAEVRAAVAAAWQAPLHMGAMIEEDGFEAAGLLGPTATARVLAQASVEVLRPAARALMAA